MDHPQQGSQAWFQRCYPVAYLQDPDPAKPSANRSPCLRDATAEAQGLLFVFAGVADQAASQPWPLVPVLAEQAPSRGKLGAQQTVFQAPGLISPYKTL